MVKVLVRCSFNLARILECQYFLPVSTFSASASVHVFSQAAFLTSGVTFKL